MFILFSRHVGEDGETRMVTMNLKSDVEARNYDEVCLMNVCFYFERIYLLFINNDVLDLLSPWWPSCIIPFFIRIDDIHIQKPSPSYLYLCLKVARAEKLKPMELALRKLEDLSESIVGDFARMKTKEEEHRDTNGLFFPSYVLIVFVLGLILIWSQN